MRTRSLVRSAPWSQPSGRRSLQGGPYPARGRGLTPRRQASVLILAWRDPFLDRCNLSITILGRNVRQGEVFLPRPPPLSPSGQVDIPDVAFTSVGEAARARASRQADPRSCPRPGRRDLEQEQHQGRDEAKAG